MIEYEIGIVEDQSGELNNDMVQRSGTEDQSLQPASDFIGDGGMQSQLPLSLQLYCPTVHTPFKDQSRLEENQTQTFGLTAASPICAPHYCPLSDMRKLH